MNQKITSFYRLTEQEKEKLIRECRIRIEEEKVREIGEVRKILEELLEEKWSRKENVRVSGLQKKLEEERRLNRILQERQELSEADAADLRARLKTAEKNAEDLQERLTKAEAEKDELQDLLSLAEEQIGDYGNRLEQSEKEAGDYRRRMEEAQSELEFMCLQPKDEKTEKRPPRRRRQKSSLRKKIALGLAGCFAGLTLTAAVGAFVVPVRYYEAEASQKLWYTDGTYTVSYGENLFGNIAGFSYSRIGDDVQTTDIVFDGRSLGLMQTYFPDGSRYCGIGVFARPDGFGVYTLPDGERLFGIWDFTEDLEYVMNGETYRYVGMLRSGQPHGYGVLEDSAGNRCFSGEFSESMTIQGEWLPEEEGSSDDNAEVSEEQESTEDEKG